LKTGAPGRLGDGAVLMVAVELDEATIVVLEGIVHSPKRAPEGSYGGEAAVF